MPVPLTATTNIDREQRRRNWLLMGAFLVGVVGVCRILTMLSVTSIHNDFSHYYLGGAMFADGLSPYVEPLEPLCTELGWQYDPMIPNAAHPPLILTLFACLSVLPPVAAYSVWLVIQFVILFASLEVTRRIVRTKWTSPVWVWLVAVFLNSSSIMALFYYSQVQMLIGLFIYAALLAHLNGRHQLACGLATFIAAFKIYPAVLLPWLLLKGLKSKSDFISRSTAIALVGLGCLIVPGVSTWIEFVTVGIPTLSGNSLKWTNYSIQNFVYIFARTPLAQSYVDPHGLVVKIIALGGSVLLIAGAYAAAVLKCRDSRDAFCILIIAAVTGGFISWAHYLTILFLPVALVICRKSTLKNAQQATLAAIVGGLVLIPQVDFLLFGTTGGVPRVIIHFYPLVGIALTGLLIVAWREKKFGNPWKCSQNARATNGRWRFLPVRSA